MNSLCAWHKRSTHQCLWPPSWWCYYHHLPRLEGCVKTICPQVLSKLKSRILPLPCQIICPFPGHQGCLLGHHQPSTDGSAQLCGTPHLDQGCERTAGPVTQTDTYVTANKTGPLGPIHFQVFKKIPVLSPKHFQFRLVSNQSITSLSG